MSKALALVMAAGVVWPAVAGAQITGPSERLSLEKAVELALGQRARLRQAEHEALAAEHGVREARAGYFPQVYLQGIVKDGLSGATGGLGLVGLPASPFFDKVADSVNVTYEVYDFGRTPNRLQAARFTAASLRSLEEAEKARVIWQVQTAFYRCLQADELLKVARETLEERKLTARQAQVYFEVQLRSKLDANLAQVNLSSAEAALVRAENERRIELAGLSRAMGVWGRPVYDLEAVSLELESVEPLENLIERALASRPELLALERQVRAAEASLEATRSERLPRITAAASAGYARFETVPRDAWAVGLGFSVPLFTGFALESRVDQARERLWASEAARSELLLQVRFEVEQAFVELATARESARAAEPSGRRPATARPRGKLNSSSKQPGAGQAPRYR